MEILNYLHFFYAKKSSKVDLVYKDKKTTQCLWNFIES